MYSNFELTANLAYYEARYYDATYNSSSQDLRTMLLCSKASILEVCGWVEEAMDLLVRDAAQRCELSAARLKWIDKEYVRPTYGFSYQKHFEKMIVSVVGYRILETAERNVCSELPAMNGSLTFLTPLRNYYAHTHLNLTNPFPKDMTSIPAPTAMTQHANNVVAGLSALENQLMVLGC